MGTVKKGVNVHHLATHCEPFSGKGADAEFEASRRDLSINTGCVACTLSVGEKRVNEANGGGVLVLNSKWADPVSSSPLL